MNTNIPRGILLNMLEFQSIIFCIVIFFRLSSSKLTRVARIQSLLDTYKQSHDVSSLRSMSHSQLCNQKFVVSTAACRDAGNGIGVFLDNLAWSVVLNRTIIVRWNEKTNFCFGSVNVQNWITSWDTLDQLLVSAGCPLDYKSEVLRITGTDRAISCCDVEGIPSRAISPGATAKLSFETLRWELENSRILSNETQSRHNLLFSHQGHRASFEAFGFLTMWGLNFTSVVKSLSEDALGSMFDQPIQDANDVFNSHSTSSVSIGVHIRHQKLDSVFEVSVDNGFERCLKHFVRNILDSQISRSLPCYLLIATDRSSTLERLIALAPELGCTAKYVTKPQSKNKPGMRNHRGKAMGEHGPWGETAVSMADWYLLSNSQYFLGTRISSYSTIIANVVSAKRSLFQSKRGGAGGRLGSTVREHGNAFNASSEVVAHMWAVDIPHIVSEEHKRVQEALRGADFLPCSAYVDKVVVRGEKRPCSASFTYYNTTRHRCILEDRK